MEDESDNHDSDFEQPAEQISQRSNEGLDGWIYKRPCTQGVKFTPNLTCKEKIIGHIRNVLLSFGEDTYEKFRTSCFTEFTKLPEYVGKSASSLHYVMANEVELPNNDGDSTELHFLINGKRLRFSRFEYALITGLRFGGSSFHPYNNNIIPETSVYTRLFGNKKICVEKLHIRFMDRQLGEKPEDYVKVAKILFVYFVLLGQDPRKTMVLDWMWVLVEDENEWDCFSWGSYSYQRLLHYLKGVKVAPSGTKREAYHLYGFTTAFIAWIYCAIPQLGKSCGGIASKDILPRMLRFHYTRSNIHVTGVTGQLHVTLKPNADERKTKYWLSIEPEGNAFEVTYDHEREKRLNNRIAFQAEVISNCEVTASYKTQMDSHTQNKPKQKTPNKVETLEAEENPVDEAADRHNKQTYEAPIIGFTWAQQQSWIEDIGLRVYNRLRNDDGFIEDIGSYAAAKIKKELSNCTPIYEGFQRNKYTAQGGNDNVSKSPVENLDIEHEDQVQEDQFWSEAIEKFNEICQQNTPAARRQINVDVNEIKFPHKLDFLDVRRRKTSCFISSPFRPFEKRGVDYSTFLRGKTRRNVGIGYAVSASYFKEILDMSTQLDTCHIDAYLSLLFMNPEFANLRQCDKRVTITSTAFLPAVHHVWAKYHDVEELSQTDTQESEEIIMISDLFELSKFVIGDMPRWGQSRPWYDYDKVIMVVHIPVHWVTCTLNLKDCSIMVYDSTQHQFEQNDYVERIQFFTPFSRILPQVIQYSGFYDARHDVIPNLHQWSILFPECENIFMQNDEVNCGVYALKYVEAILTGNFDQTFEEKELKAFRTKIATSIYHFSTNEDTI